MRRFSDSLLAVLVVTALAAAVAPLPARGAAQAFDPYVVRLTVAAEGESGVAAKEAALQRAEVDALSRLLDRIASRDDLRRLSAPHAALAGSLMNSLSIVSERATARAYRADVMVAFSRGALRDYLTSRAVRFVDEPAPPVLVVPVVLTAAGANLWDDAEPWRRALSGADMEEGLTPVRFPGNTAEDRQERTERLLAGDRVSLDTFRIRYRTEATVVAVLDLRAGDGDVRLSLIGSDAAGPLSHDEALTGPDRALAARRVADVLSERWKQAVGDGFRAPSPAGRGAALAVRVLLRAGPPEWDDIRRRLEASGQIASLSVETISQTQASVILWPRQPGGDLSRSLGHYGLDLFQAGGAWVLQAY